jgi:HSP20 family protein
MNIRPLVPFRSRATPSRRESNAFDFLQREIESLFDDFGRGFAGLPASGGGRLLPDIEIAETDKNIEITAELPGLERGDVDISLEGNLLTIRAEKKAETDRNDKNVHLTERSYGVFYRVLELPATVDPSTVQATMSNGVLKISIPKPPATQKNRLEVQEAQQSDQPNRQGKQATQPGEPGQSSQPDQADGSKRTEADQQRTQSQGEQAAE